MTSIGTFAFDKISNVLHLRLAFYQKTRTYCPLPRSTTLTTDRIPRPQTRHSIFFLTMVSPRSYLPCLYLPFTGNRSAILAQKHTLLARHTGIHPNGTYFG